MVIRFLFFASFSPLISSSYYVGPPFSKHKICCMRAIQLFVILSDTLPFSCLVNEPQGWPVSLPLCLPFLG
ncbi:hypothetical protein LY78DRAFT_652659 [Colletotrichum sublineola]|nr:hypothetical protein LY78DRAFT_652659 [Colletotrichum sublineola]